MVAAGLEPRGAYYRAIEKGAFVAVKLIENGVCEFHR